MSYTCLPYVTIHVYCSSTNSEKYKAARQQRNIKCVNLSWITDSIEKGYALPHTNYQVRKMTSTPTKPNEQVNPEFSMISAIGAPNMSQRGLIEETMASPFSPLNNRSNGKRKGKKLKLKWFTNMFFCSIFS